MRINVEEIGGHEALILIAKFKGQLPYATAVGINETLKEVQTAEVQNIQGKFNNRKPWFKPRTPMGVNIDFARKDKPEAAIFTRYKPMELHEEGGTKTPKGKHIAIPQRGNLRVSNNKVIPDRKLAKNLLDDPRKPRAFKARMPSGKYGIWVRTGKARNPIKLLYAFRQSAKIKKVLQFRGLGYDVFMKSYQNHFGKALAHAITTSRK